MDANTQAVKLKLAWQQAWRERSCPGDDLLFADQPTEEVTRHLRMCPSCQELRNAAAATRNAWRELASKLCMGASANRATGVEPVEGQIWTLRDDLSHWGSDGNYYRPPQVLLLRVDGNALTVAQTYHDSTLAGDGDVVLTDGTFGFAESWNIYTIHREMRDHCLGAVTGDDVRAVLREAEKPRAELDEDSILYWFRTTEVQVGSEIAVPAVAELVAVDEKEQPTESLLQKLADWLRPLLSPAPLAAAAAIVVVIGVALYNSGKISKVNVAQYPTPAPPSATSTQAGSRTTESTQSGTRKQELQRRPPQAPTLLACADIVMLSKGSPMADEIEVTRGGHKLIDTDKAAYKTGIAFVNLIAADKVTDMAAKDEAIRQLAQLIPMVTGGTSINPPVQLSNKEKLASFTRALEEAASRSGQLSNLQFGSWLQSARLADDTQLLKAVTPDVIEHFKSELTKQKTASATVSILTNLQVLLAKKGSEALEIRNYVDDLFDAY